MGCMTAKFDPNAVNYAYALRAVSPNEDAADALMQAVLSGKVGTPVDPAVTVDAFLELTVRDRPSLLADPAQLLPEVLDVCEHHRGRGLTQRGRHVSIQFRLRQIGK